MLTAKEIIEFNLSADFEVLSDYAFYRAGEFFLGPPMKRRYKPKVIRSDQDGVWEAKNTSELCDLTQEKLGEENNGMKHSLPKIFELFEEPPEVQEEEITRAYQSNGVTFSQFWRANYNASREFRFAQNSLPLVSRLRSSLGYQLEIYSGSFQKAIVRKKNRTLVYPLALELVWKNMGLPRKFINGSVVYFDENGLLTKIELMLREKKKEAMELLQFYLVFSDNLLSDRPMMECSLDLHPIALVFGDFNSSQLPQYTRIPSKQMKENMLEAVKPILRIERGLMQNYGMKESTLLQARYVASEIEMLAAECSTSVADNSVFDKYVDSSLRFLNLLTLRFDGRWLNLFPERRTQIRKYLQMVRYERDSNEKRSLVETTFDILKRYSAEFS